MTPIRKIQTVCHLVINYWVRLRLYFNSETIFISRWSRTCGKMDNSSFKTMTFSQREIHPEIRRIFQRKCTQHIAGCVPFDILFVSSRYLVRLLRYGSSKWTCPNARILQCSVTHISSWKCVPSSSNSEKKKEKSCRASVCHWPAHAARAWGRSVKRERVRRGQRQRNAKD